MTRDTVESLLLDKELEILRLRERVQEMETRCVELRQAAEERVREANERMQAEVEAAVREALALDGGSCA